MRAARARKLHRGHADLLPEEPAQVACREPKPPRNRILALIPCLSPHDQPDSATDNFGCESIDRPGRTVRPASHAGPVPGGLRGSGEVEMPNVGGVGPR